MKTEFLIRTDVKVSEEEYIKHEIVLYNRLIKYKKESIQIADVAAQKKKIKLLKELKQYEISLKKYKE